MTDGSCQYFNIYDHQRGEWTRWGETIAEQVKKDWQRNNMGFNDEFNKAKDPDAIIEKFRDRHFGDVDESEVLSGLENEIAPEGLMTSMRFRGTILALDRWLDNKGLKNIECDHECYEDYDYCIFHLPKDEKERLEKEEGLDMSSKVREEFQERIESNKSNSFLGARLNALNLEHEIIDTQEDSKPINLNFSDINELDLGRAEIKQAIKIEGARVDKAVFDGAVFDRDASFKGTSFGPRDCPEDGLDCCFSFKHASVLRGELNFEGASFMCGVDFKAATCSGRMVSFKDTYFNSDANFLGTDWNTWKLIFRSVQFEDKVDFESASFINHETVFSRVIFGAENSEEACVSFRGAVFGGGRTEFRNTNFKGESVFDSVVFDGQTTNFSESRFEEPASFRHAQFKCRVDFSNIPFGSSSPVTGCVSIPEKIIRRSESDSEEEKKGRSRQTSESSDSWFTGNDYCDGFDFTAAVFHGQKAAFQQSRFQDAVTFESAEFDCEVDFSETVFERIAVFKDSIFRNRKTKLNRTTFYGGACFKNTVFEHGAEMKDSDFGGGQADFRRLEVHSQDFDLSNGEFRCGAVFNDANITGTYAYFNKSKFRTDSETALSFKNVEFDCRKAVFDGIECWGKRSVFSNSSFHETLVTFEEATFRIPATTDDEREPSIDFSSIVIKDEELRMEGVRSRTEKYDLRQQEASKYIEGKFPEVEALEILNKAEGGLSQKELRKKLKSRLTSGGEAPGPEDSAGNLQIKADGGVIDPHDTDVPSGDVLRKRLLRLGWASASDGDARDASQAESKLVPVVERPDSLPTKDALRNIRQNNFEDRTRYLSELKSRGLITAERQCSDEEGEFNQRAQINMQNAIIEDGCMLQPTDGSYGPTTYDLERAEVGKIDLGEEETETKSKLAVSLKRKSPFHTRDEYGVFDNLRFKKTEFEGFNFDNYENTLRRSGWEIHTVRGTEKELDADEKEDTYRMAKNGANKIGENEAASEFFKKELKSRRAKHRKYLLTGNGPPRIKSLYDYVANLLMGKTSGYGEQPGLAIVVSLVVVVVFAGIFEITAILASDLSGDDFNGLILSAESFTTLVLGGREVQNGIIRSFGYAEGFIGAFLIALFVFTLTRSIHR